jgi:hypothetical protein
MFLHPDDEPEFDLFLRASGAVLVPEMQREGALITVADTLSLDPDVDGSRIHLVRPEDVGGITSQQLPPPHRPVVHHGSQSVQYDRSMLRSDRLIVGGLAFETSHVEGGRVVRRPDAFVEWADAILRGARRRLARRTWSVGGTPYTAHVGAAASAWADAHDATIPVATFALVATR